MNISKRLVDLVRKLAITGVEIRGFIEIQVASRASL